ncbi:TPA: hypothetical protein L5649_005851 [Pseudomonas aeruginosa]|nr:hypothetical protein [Pseudomonas aeruginosa]
MTESKICTCPSGDGSLRWPCPAHPAVEQAGGDERAEFERAFTVQEGIYFDDKRGEYRSMNLCAIEASDAQDLNLQLQGWQARAALAQPSPAQAEAEQPEVVAWQYRVTAGPQTGWSLWHPGKGEEFERSYTVERRPLMTVAQHDRIVGVLRADLISKDEIMRAWQRAAERKNQIAADAQARVAKLELGIARIAGDFLPDNSGQAELALDEMRQALHELLAAAPTQAQHSVPEEFSFEYRHPNGESHTVTVSRDQVINEMPDFLFEALCSKFCNCEPVGETNVVECCCDEYAEEFKLLAAAPGNSVPQAWLDVQAERRRQVTAEGWTPEHDDAHSHGQMARAAACYALAGSSAPNDGTAALLVSLAWPWDEQWWKPSTARRDLVKACALALAEIERLDRAGISQSPQPGATTASS